jgi:hypothetical protein
MAPFLHSQASLWRCTLSLLLLLSRIRSTASDALGIPGTTQTLGGYDTEMGEDPICWSSRASATPTGGVAFPNGVLVQNFSLADKVELLPLCPPGTWLEAHAPAEFSQPDFHPRTLQWYNYTVKGRIDLIALNGIFVTADKGSKIAIGIIACDTLTAGFCSPFVHEQANLRLARERTAKEEKGIPIPARTKKIPGNRHGGTHVHAPAVVLDVPKTPMLAYEFEFQVPLIVNDPGNFFMIGTLQFFTGETRDTPVYRYDVATAPKAEERSVIYQTPATILEITESVRIISYVFMGLTSAVLLGLIAQTIKHYTHQVLQMSQAPFLLVFLLAALTATVSSVLCEPRNDLWCNLSQPLVMIPLQLFYAITLGRLWRIHAVVSPLLRDRIHRSTAKRETDGCFGRLWQKTSLFKSNGPRNFRKVVSPAKVVWIVLICTIPQVILQVISWNLQPHSKVVVYNEDQSIGRCICDDGMDSVHSIQNYSYYLLLLLVLCLLLMAHVSRKLPSLLNESTVIYDTTLVSVLLGVLGFGVNAATAGPTTSPDVAYMIRIFVVLSITLNSALRIMVPKLRMVWSNQVILVSQLVADQKQALRHSTSASSASYMPNVTGLEDPTHSFCLHDSHGSTESGRNSRKTGEKYSRTSDDFPYSGTDSSVHHPGEASTTEHNSDGVEELDVEKGAALTGTQSQNVWLENVEGANASDEEKASRKRFEITRRVTFHQSKQDAPKTDDGQQKSTDPELFVVRQGETPCKTLVLKMVDLKDELDHVTNQVMSGLNVEPKDWKAVRKRTQRLGALFEKMEFDFEQENEKAPTATSKST